ncbi:putative membrane protein [Youngiibacter multivorans]|uniref:Membrane protein n=1 Tax=Youngiibacter multivorans TaxID=937251 RepID=A0ABS4G1B5_9CLOT|nr:putative membrane protein [Youngiibacter multivorans]
MNNQLQGYTMAVLGLIFLLFNALSYIFDWESRSSAFSILGLVCVVIGMNRARKN